jgi:hypothetical protein
VFLKQHGQEVYNTQYSTQPQPPSKDLKGLITKELSVLEESRLELLGRRNELNIADFIYLAGVLSLSTVGFEISSKNFPKIVSYVKKMFSGGMNSLMLEEVFDVLVGEVASKNGFENLYLLNDG